MAAVGEVKDSKPVRLNDKDLELADKLPAIGWASTTDIHEKWPQGDKTTTERRLAKLYNATPRLAERRGDEVKGYEWQGVQNAD
jgi:hypothetical protein